MKNKAPPKQRARKTKPRNRLPGNAGLVVPNRQRNPALNLSKAGIDFLKCAFAAPDFADDQGAGIPLGGDHKVLLKKHRLETSVALAGAATTGTSYHYLILPTPGQAVWTASSAIGTQLTYNTAWAPTSFSDSFGDSGLFSNGPGSRAANVDQYRYASLSAEVKDVTSIYTSTGTVFVQKFPIKNSQTLVTQSFVTANGWQTGNIVARYTSGTPSTVTFADSASPANTVTLGRADATFEYPVLNGLDVTGQNPVRSFAGHIREGAFARSVRARDDYGFRPIMEGIESLSSGNQFGNLSGNFLGADDAMEAIHIRIDVPASVNLNVRVRVWACVEYKPLNQSSLYEYARLAPDRDMLAIALYYKYAQQLPIAVIAAENDFSWKRLWEWVKSALTAVSFIPGPVGVAAMAAGALGEAVERLVL